MNRRVHASALTGGVATALAVGILAVNIVWPSTPTPGAVADVTPLSTSQTVTSTGDTAPIVRDSYTVTSVPATTTSTAASTTATATGTRRSATAEALLCAAGEEATPSEADYGCGPADLADPTMKSAQMGPVLDPAAPTGTPDTRTHGAGVPTGAQLRVVNGDQTITQDGTTLDGLDIRGRVIIKANNVTIRNSVIRGKEGGRHGIVDAMHGFTGLKISDTEIAAQFPNAWVNGIMGWNFELTRVNIHTVVDPVHIAGGNVVVRDSWLHDNTWFADDPYHSDGSHDDSVEIVGGDNILLEGNIMEGASNVGIMITQDRSLTSNVTIVHNRLASGDCTINISTKGKGPMQNMVVNYNLFDTNTSIKRCAVYSPIGTVSMTGNFYTDGVAAVLRTR